MTKNVNALITKLSEQPKKLFLIDGIGALLTAILIGGILVQLSPLIGLSKIILFQLGAIAILFALYSFSCYLYLKKTKPIFFQLIGYGNLLYCGLTLLILLINCRQVQPLGYVYFFAEIVIIFVLSYIELSVANNLKIKGQ